MFTPVVDDPVTWGRIAAVNAVSDVYAMGGTPLFALAIAAWPHDRLPIELLGDVLRGGQDAAADGGWVVAGGHTLDGAEPLYGQAVIGEVDPEAVLTNAGGRPGDALVLTKPLGTGVIATAHKRRAPEEIAPGGGLHGSYTAAVREMTRTNAEAARAAARAGAHAMTDVTGFGLLGHLRQLASASGVGASVDAGSVPRLPDVDELVRRGEVPGGTRRNLTFVRERLSTDAGVGEDALLALADAQTSGGLLIALPAERGDALVTELVASGHGAARVGHLDDGRPGHLTVRA